MVWNGSRNHPQYGPACFFQGVPYLGPILRHISMLCLRHGHGVPNEKLKNHGSPSGGVFFTAPSFLWLQRETGRTRHVWATEKDEPPQLLSSAPKAPTKISEPRAAAAARRPDGRTFAGPPGPKARVESAPERNLQHWPPPKTQGLNRAQGGIQRAVSFLCHFCIISIICIIGISPNHQSFISFLWLCQF